MTAPSPASVPAPALTGGWHSARLAGPIDLDGFRQQARALVQAGVPPERVRWCVDEDDATPDLFNEEANANSATVPTPSPTANRPLRVPTAFLALCQDALLHQSTDRFALLYRLLWRLVREPSVRHDPLDADRLQAEQWARAVRRDHHKMTAFVRFRCVEPGGASRMEAPHDRPLHVAWFEPEHHIVEASAPFFARRFTQMHWAILTPRRCVRWDGQALHFGPGARREEAPDADDGERLWLTYYAHIFNPSRLKPKMMQKEMPKRYWHNLPEATLIAPLMATATARSDTMIERSQSGSLDD